ncbi:MAG: hypothetical protein AAF623_11970 [Planctomycetota bacterium]
MMTRIITVGLFLSCLAQDFTFKEFQAIHRELTSVEESWKQIPWKTDLLEAQRVAAEQNKPIFVWSMDGHPLACV